MKRAALVAMAIPLLLFSGAARAQNLADQATGTTTFGGAGQVAIAGDFSMRFEHVSGSSTLEIAPAVDYFLAPQLSLGGQVFFIYTDSVTTFGIGPRVGYNIPLAPMFTLYPRAGFSVEHVSGGGASASYLGLFLFAPFLFHPVPHFFIGLGPSLDGLVAGGQPAAHNLAIGLKSTVGGYLDW